MGHSDIDSGTFLHVKSVLIHPDYEIFALPGLQAIADIALLRLNESLTFNDSIQPITLPTDDISNISTSFENKENIANQFTYHVAGWGLTATVNGAMLENKEDFMKNFQELQENA